MKCKTAILVIITMVLMSACASDSILGKWKVIRKYNAGKGTWKTLSPPSFAPEITFLSDGKFHSLTSNTAQTGSYTSDTTIEPHRLVTSSPVEGRNYSVYKVEGNKLILKSYRDKNLGFPADVGIEPEGKLYDLLEFERQ